MKASATVLALVVVLAAASVPTGAVASPADYCLPIDRTVMPWTTHLAADIDADGRADRVITRSRTSGSGRCRARLIVSTRRTTFRAQIEPFTGAIVDPPGLAGAIQLVPGRRLEIAVVVWLGASTGFVDVYGLRGDRLQRLSASPFPYAGSAVNISGVDCARTRSAELVASTAEWNDSIRRYRVERVYFSLRRGMLRPIPRLTERNTVKMSELEWFPELVAFEPFPRCTVVQGTS